MGARAWGRGRRLGSRGWGAGGVGQGPGGGHGGCSSDAKPGFSLQFLSQCLQVALAARLGKEYSPEVHSAVDKFMAAVAAVLAEKYR